MNQRWLLIIVSSLTIFFLAASGWLFYQNLQLQKQISQLQTPPSPSPAKTPMPSPDPTANWETYSNIEIGFSFKYPTDLTMQKRSTTERETYWDGELNGTSYVLTSGYIPQDSLNAMGITYCGAYPENARCENYKWDNLEATIDWNIETEGAYTQSMAQTQHPSGGAVIISIFHPPTLEIKTLFRQILSTFKFLDDTEPEPSPSTPLEKIPTISTNDWKSASNNGVEFKIPPESACNDNQACSFVSWTSQYQGHTLYHNIRVEVKDYLGGSRRDQFYQNVQPECHDIYQEANFGSVKALQIAIDGGWCQGGGGGIVTVIGDKLVIIHNLIYNSETKDIYRWDIQDTLVSTLKQI